MLGNYESRRFEDGEKVWIGRYRDLINVLHWHFECEIIHIVSGKAKIKIGESVFNATEGDSFFCADEELHYIISEKDALIDVMIIERSVLKDVTRKNSLSSPKLPDFISVGHYFDHIREHLREKGRFYREAIENYVRYVTLEIFRRCDICERTNKNKTYKKLFSLINDSFAFITFGDAVKGSGYTPAHFSRVFKELTGMTFSKYLNIIKIENAILMLKQDKLMSITAVSQKCGFSTVRNFNRVFREVTGYSPRSLPEDFMLDSSLLTLTNRDFDPTTDNSELI